MVGSTFECVCSVFILSHPVRYDQLIKSLEANVKMVPRQSDEYQSAKWHLCKKVNCSTCRFYSKKICKKVVVVRANKLKCLSLAKLSKAKGYLTSRWPLYRAKTFALLALNTPTIRVIGFIATLNKTGFIVTLSIASYWILSPSRIVCCYAIIFIIILSVIMLSVVILSVVASLYV